MLNATTCRPNFIVISRFAIPADGPWDPERRWSNVDAYACTAEWAHVLAARAARQHYGEPDDSGYCDPYPYCGTEVMTIDSRGWCVRVPRQAQPATVCDEDIPF